MVKLKLKSYEDMKTAIEYIESNLNIFGHSIPISSEYMGDIYLNSHNCGVFIYGTESARANNSKNFFSITSKKAFECERVVTMDEMLSLVSEAERQNLLYFITEIS